MPPHRRAAFFVAQQMVTRRGRLPPASFQLPGKRIVGRGNVGRSPRPKRFIHVRENYGGRGELNQAGYGQTVDDLPCCWGLDTSPPENALQLVDGADAEAPRKVFQDGDCCLVQLKIHDVVLRSEDSVVGFVRDRDQSWVSVLIKALINFRTNFQAQLPDSRKEQGGLAAAASFRLSTGGPAIMSGSFVCNGTASTPFKGPPWNLVVGNFVCRRYRLHRGLLAFEERRVRFGVRLLQPADDRQSLGTRVGRIDLGGPGPKGGGKLRLAFAVELTCPFFQLVPVLGLFQGDDRFQSRYQKTSDRRNCPLNEDVDDASDNAHDFLLSFGLQDLHCFHS